jgi:hypothetical protein
MTEQRTFVLVDGENIDATIGPLHTIIPLEEFDAMRFLR